MLAWKFYKITIGNLIQNGKELCIEEYEEIDELFSSSSAYKLLWNVCVYQNSFKIY